MNCESLNRVRLTQVEERLSLPDWEMTTMMTMGQTLKKTTMLKLQMHNSVKKSG